MLTAFLPRTCPLQVKTGNLAAQATVYKTAALLLHLRFCMLNFGTDNTTYVCHTTIAIKSHMSVSARVRG